MLSKLLIAMASLCIPKLLSRSLPTMACTVWHYNYQLVLVAIVIAITETFWQIIPATIADYCYKSLKVQIFYSSFSLKSSQIFSTSLVLVGSSSLTSNGGTLRPSFGPLWKRRSFIPEDPFILRHFHIRKLFLYSLGCWSSSGRYRAYPTITAIQITVKSADFPQKKASKI